jgi:malate dehydrogenase
MSEAAILGAGPIGSAIAHRLAEQNRLRDVHLIDGGASIAAGKALDILQSGPIGKYDTRVSGSDDVLSAATAGVVILADDTTGGEWDGDRGLDLIRRVLRAGSTAPFVLAGPKQLWLMETAARELKLPHDRILGTAASALPPTIASLIGIELGETGANVTVTGRPPSFVINWTAATIGGALLTDRVPAHRLLAISNSLPRLWPPGPQAIAAPTAAIVEALLHGSRHLHQALTILNGELGATGPAAMLPLELGRGRVLGRLIPSLSPQERTETLNSIGRR